CGLSGSIEVVFRATDECGNYSETTASFTIEDNTSPELEATASDETVECDGYGNVLELQNWLDGHGGANASDICGDVTWSHDYAGGGWISGCGGTQYLEVEFTATDECGNKVSTGARFTIEDHTAPVIQQPAVDQTVECDGLGNQINLQSWLDGHGGALATDLCGAVSWSHDYTSLTNDCGATGSALVTFRATDACGNYTETAATFTIEDKLAPVIQQTPVDLIVECDGAGNTAAIQN